jgi:drug/metabolite transporter (DMT)-like permease
MKITPEQPCESGRKKTVLTLCLSAICATVYFFLLKDFSTNWDGFFMLAMGNFLGSMTVVTLALRGGKRLRSDGPALLASTSGMAIMGAVWWYSSVESSAMIGAVCRAVMGVWIGFMIVEVLTYEKFRPPADPVPRPGNDTENPGGCPTHA